MKNQIRFKNVQTRLLAALCFIFTYLQIKIPVPGGDAISLHIEILLCFSRLLLGGWYGGLAGQ
ncbi:MAG: ECF transporter S component [Clostridium sp.]